MFSTFTVLSRTVLPITVLFGPKLFHHHKKKPCTYQQSLPVPPSSKLLALLSCFLSFCLCLSWTFHVSRIIHETFFVCLLSLGFMILMFIDTVVCVTTSFLFMVESYSIVWRDHILFIHLFVDGHLGWPSPFFFFQKRATRLSKVKWLHQHRRGIAS